MASEEVFLGQDELVLENLLSDNQGYVICFYFRATVSLKNPASWINSIDEAVKVKIDALDRCPRVVVRVRFQKYLPFMTR